MNVVLNHHIPYQVVNYMTQVNVLFSRITLILGVTKYVFLYNMLSSNIMCYLVLNLMYNQVKTCIEVQFNVVWMRGLVKRCVELRKM